MTAGQTDIGHHADEREHGARRRVRRLIASLAVLLPVLVLLVARFGGPVVGKLVMSDLDGRRYTVTSIRIDGAEIPLPAAARTISFRDDQVRWNAGCNQQSSRYEVVWSTLHTIGPQVSTAMGCGEVTPAEAALGVVSLSPEIHLDENNRLLMSTAHVSLELVES